MNVGRQSRRVYVPPPGKRERVPSRPSTPKYGVCVESTQENVHRGKRRIYGTVLCDYHYKTPAYRLITKSTAAAKYRLDGRWIEDAVKAGRLTFYKLPNPYNPGSAPPMKLIREYELWSLLRSF